MSLKNKPLKILSIKPGTRQLAVAVLEGRDLLYWKNKMIREQKIASPRALRKLKLVLDTLFDFWKPDVVAVEDSSFYVQAKESPLLNKMAQKIEEICTKRGVDIYFYSPPAIRKFICRDVKPNKMNAAAVLATSHYPWLYDDYQKEKRKKWYESNYGLRVFDAVAVGLFCHHKLKKRRKIKK